MVKVIMINPYEDPRWLDFLGNYEGATIFHHPNWMRTLDRTYRYRPFCCAAVKDEKFIGVLPLVETGSRFGGRRAVSLPFSDFCGPLCDDDVMQLFKTSTAELMKREQWNYIEYRELNSKKKVIQDNIYFHHTLNLDPAFELVFRKFHKNQVQRSIVKAEKLGVKVERRNDLESMREFVKLNYITRKKHGLPPQPDSFFWNMHEMMISNNLGFVNIARLNDIPIAGAVFFVFKKTIYFKFGASNESFLSYRPNHIVMSEAIKWGCESGFKFFDFGRTDIADDGLLNYKRQWGTDEDNLLYYRIDRNLKIRWDLNKSSFMKLRPLIRKVPVPFLRMLGKLFYRHFG